MAQQPKLTKIAFHEQFASEEACEKQLFKLKWPEGYKCEKCGSTHHSTVTTRRLPLYQCVECGYQGSVIVNTIFEKKHITCQMVHGDI